jgi:excinuclease UvrABC ATPase subunit
MQDKTDKKQEQRKRACRKCRGFGFIQVGTGTYIGSVRQSCDCPAGERYRSTAGTGRV